MGEVKRIFITGASGFIGSATVTAARAAGMEVVAPTRSEVDLGSTNAVEDLAAHMEGCQAVVHLAAAMRGDASEHETVTVQGTRALLDAMKRSAVDRLVLVSSLSVYSLEAIQSGQAVTSKSALDSPETARDVYSGAKLRQEALAKAADLPTLTILRPGIVYDNSRLWNSHLGVGVGPVLFRFPGSTALPMCKVSTLAEHIVQAVKTEKSIEKLIVDANLPARSQVVDELRKSGWPNAVLPFPWAILRMLAKFVSSITDRGPGLLRPRVLEQRIYPLGRITSDAKTRWVLTGETAQ